jgi:hypothetical protein
MQPVRASHPVQRPLNASRNTTTAHRIPYNDRSAYRAIQRPRSASRKCNQSAEVHASHPVQRPRSASRKCNQSAEVRASHPVQRPRSASRKCNQSAEVRASHPVQRPRSASRKCNQSVEVRASHPVQRLRIALRGPRIALRGPHTLRSTLRWFRLVRGTIFSKIQYIYIFIPEHFMTHPSYWLRCENLICWFPVRFRNPSGYRCWSAETSVLQ